MAKCIRCNGEMRSFTLATMGCCNHCGLRAEDMAEILSELLAALESIMMQPGLYMHMDRRRRERAHAAIAKAKGEQT